MTVRKLPWDSDFFGYRIGQADAHDAAGAEAALRAAKDMELQCLYLFSDKPLQPELGFLAEIRHCYAKAVPADLTSWQNPPGIHLGLVEDRDLPIIKRIAQGFVLHSRFNRDKKFADKCSRYYEIYVQKEFENRHSRDHCFWVVRQQDRAIGFVTWSRESDCGRIVLIAVDQGAQRMGAGTALLHMAEDWSIHAREPVPVRSLTVRTQQVNAASCRLYEKFGFELAKRQWIYHCWMP